ncbi:MAG: 16S rRNA (guanine(527)-N(7))-methyltransferase RsmG [Streptococcaceae bacterium]|nr:16S rRNA (guanine(527)-N(7))-methyltransferase RsmG [Streptococcaceae bacterium]
MTPEEFVQALKKYGVALSIKQQEQFARYFHLLVEWNQKMNLTAITEEKEVYLKHFFDSLLPVFFSNLLSKKIYSLLDVGSGAGFPSFPMKILLPKLNVVIIDSLSKRINFLKEVEKQLNLEKISFYHGRAEDFGQNLNFRESYDFVIARAVARLNVLSELTLPFVRKGGYFIALKASKVSKEVEEAKIVIALLGGKIVNIKEYQLLDFKVSRFLVIVQKCKETPQKYPRKAGIPNKKPIAI